MSKTDITTSMSDHKNQGLKILNDDINEVVNHVTDCIDKL